MGATNSENYAARDAMRQHKINAIAQWYVGKYICVKLSFPPLCPHQNVAGFIKPCCIRSGSKTKKIQLQHYSLYPSRGQRHIQRFAYVPFFLYCAISPEFQQKHCLPYSRSKRWPIHFPFAVVTEFEFLPREKRGDMEMTSREFAAIFSHSQLPDKISPTLQVNLSYQEI